MALGRVGALLQLQARGKRLPRPGPARAKPPSNKRLEAQYAARLTTLVRAWDDHVETIARQALGIRGDALADDLRSAWQALVRSSGIEGWLARQARASAAASTGYVGTITNLDVRGAFGGDAIFRDFVRENVSLVTDMGEKHYRQIADIVSRGAVEGKRWEDMAGEIEERVGIATRRARLIARDQVGKLRASIDEVTQASAGIEEYIWDTSQDFAVRGRPNGEYEDSKENHWALQGKRFRWDSPPKIPGIDERAHPGQRPLCRCRAIPVVPEYAAPTFQRPADILAQERSLGYR